MQVLCSQPQLLWVHVCRSCVMSRRHYLTVVLLIFGCYNLSCSCLRDGPLVLRKRCDTGVTFVAEHSADTSLHFEQVRVFVLTTVLSTNKLLWKGVSTALTMDGYRDKNLEGCFNASPIWQNNGGRSVPGGHEFPSPGFLVTLTAPSMCFLLGSKVIPVTIIMPLIYCHILPDHLLLGFTGYMIRLFDNIFPQKSK